MGPEGLKIPLAFLSACGILAQGTDQAWWVPMLAGLLGSVECAGQATRTGKFALTVIVGAVEGPQFGK